MRNPHRSTGAIPPIWTGLFVKNEEGEMVPYSSFMHFEKRLGPNEITRYNMYNSASIRGLPCQGIYERGCHQSDQGSGQGEPAAWIRYRLGGIVIR
jgi:multidrug efflux pump subunit AcrB